MRNNFKDISNLKFGKLTAIKYVGDLKWYCKCDCGGEKIVLGKNLRNGLTKSCGCLNLEQVKNIKKKKWSSLKKKLKSRYRCMIARCNGKYKHKGIKVCDEWLKDFSNFYNWAVSHGFNENLPWFECSLDRIDNNGNYEPNNCRWVNAKIQANNRSNNVILRGKK
jgi:hypothetical protein